MLPHRSSSSGSAVRGCNSGLTAATSRATRHNTFENKTTVARSERIPAPTIRYDWIDHVALNDQKLEVEQGLANGSGEPFRARTLAQLPSSHHKYSSPKHARSGTMPRAHGGWIQVDPAASEFAVALRHAGSSTIRVRQRR